MDFFNDLGKKFSNVARSVTEKTKESVEVTRISGDLKNAKNELEQLFAEYGHVCYGLHRGEGSQEVAEALLKRIEDMQSRINALSAQRDELRSVRRCANCGAVQPKEARFCASCGSRMPQDAPKPEPAAAEGEACPSCGAVREPDSKFCTECGKSFEPTVDSEEPDISTQEPGD